MGSSATRPPASDPNTRFLFWLCVLCTLIYLGTMWVSFFTGHYRPSYGMTFVYGTLLMAYAGHKEFVRWYNGGHQAGRYGEFFFAAWVVSFIVMYVISRFSEAYRAPEEMAHVTAAVVLIFGVTSASKVRHHAKCNGNVNGAGTEKPPQ